MQPLDNTSLNTMQTYDKNLDYSGWTPKLSYAYNSGAKTVTVTDASTLKAGDAIKKINVEIVDDFGNKKSGAITVAAGNTGALSVAGLDPSKGLNILATITTYSGLTADGGAYKIIAAGDLGGWKKGESAANDVYTTQPG